jgi:hypothetical protein
MWTAGWMNRAARLPARTSPEIPAPVWVLVGGTLVNWLGPDALWIACGLAGLAAMALALAGRPPAEPKAAADASYVREMDR